MGVSARLSYLSVISFNLSSFFKSSFVCLIALTTRVLLLSGTLSISTGTSRISSETVLFEIRFILVRGK